MVAPAAGMGHMSEWPEGWFRDGGAGRPSGTPGAAGPGEPTASVPGPSHGAGRGQPPDSWRRVRVRPARFRQRLAGSSRRPAPARSSPRAGRAAASGPCRAPGRVAAAAGAGVPGGGRRGLRPRRIIAILALVIVVVIVATVGMYFYLNSKLIRIDVLVDYSGRPAPGAGTELADHRVRQPPGPDPGAGAAAGHRQADDDQRAPVRHDPDPAHPVERPPADPDQPPARLLRPDPGPRVQQDQRRLRLRRRAAPGRDRCRTSPACTSTTTWASASAGS